MPIVNGLITLEEAKKSIFGSLSVSADDADIEDYISAATPVIEDIVGPVRARTETVTVNGGRDTIVLPWPVATITSITENGAVVTDFTANIETGVIYGGLTGNPRTWRDGTRNIIVVVTVGGPVPPNVKLGTRELVRFWWQQGRQGNRPAFGNDADIVETPKGFAVPRRVIELCNPRVDGFA